MFVCIDDFYSVDFYNSCIEALKNNRVPFKQFISSKPPYKFYFEVEDAPTFINYEESSKTYSKYLINIVIALKPNDDYIYFRRPNIVNKKALLHYGVNDALRAGIESGEGVFFTATKEEILKISKEYGRKIYYFGRYFNRKYKVFFTDSLMVKNFIRTEDVLAESGTGDVTQMELDLNFKIFKLQDRLVKISETPYIQNGKYSGLSSVRPEISDRYVLS